MLNVINVLKKSIKEQVNEVASGYHKDLIEALFIEETTDTLTDTSSVLNFSDLLDLFLNPSKFQYVSESKLNNMDKLIKGIQTAGDVIFGDFGKLQELTSNAVDGSAKIREINLKMMKKDIQDNPGLTNQEKVTQTKQLETTLQGAEIDSTNGKIKPVNTSLKIGKIIAAYELARTVWEMGNMLSFLTYKTYENDLGNGQVLTYKVMGFRIPLLGIDIDNNAFKDHISATQLIDTAFIPKLEKETDEFLVVFGSLFTNRDAAESYLKSYILNNPLKFKDTQVYYTNIMSQQEKYKVIFDYESDSGVSEVIDKQLNEFILKIFNQYFADNAVKAYSDGFGNFYSNKADALINMSQNITNKKFNIKYKIVQNNLSYYYDSFEDAWSMQKIFVEKQLQQKSILNTDLIKTTVFNELEEQQGLGYSVFKVYFDGKYRYFATYDDALYYIVENSDVKRISDSLSYYEISFKGQLFKSEAQFYKWVAENTKVKKVRVE